MSSARLTALPLPAPVGAPRAQGLLPRERLLERLDAAVGASLWIAAPAGHGKTSLAASYAQVRGLACIWLPIICLYHDGAAHPARRRTT
jgi:ATP/maltotriose-dependent transcriptional regulator MalT